MRGETFAFFSNGAALINDSYNSSPAALHAMTAPPRRDARFFNAAFLPPEKKCAKLGANKRVNSIVKPALPPQNPAKSIGSSASPAMQRKIIERRPSGRRLQPRSHQIFCLVRRRPAAFVQQIFFKPGDLLLVKRFPRP